MDYERDNSHTHCYLQDNLDPTGHEKHVRCCICYKQNPSNEKKCSHGMCGRNSGSEWCRARACRDSGCHENPVQEKCGVRVMLEKGLHFDCILPSGHKGLHDAIFPDDAEWKMSKESIDTEKPPHCTCGPTSVTHLRGCYEGWGTVTTDHFVDVNKMVPDDAGGWESNMRGMIRTAALQTTASQKFLPLEDEIIACIARLLEQERGKAFSIHGQISQAALWFDRGAQAERSRIEEAIGKMKRALPASVDEWMEYQKVLSFNHGTDAVLKVIRGE